MFAALRQAPFLPKYSDAVGNRTDVRLLNHKLTEMYSGDYSDLVYRDPNATYVATRAETKCDSPPPPDSKAHLPTPACSEGTFERLPRPSPLAPPA